MIILAVDPGPEMGGMVILDWYDHCVLFAGHVSMSELSEVLTGNNSFDDFIGDKPNDLGPMFGLMDIHVFAIEDIVCMGKTAGKSLFRTAENIGDLRRSWWVGSKGNVSVKIARPDVKTCLCGGNTYTDPVSGRLKTVSDTTVKHAIIERFPETGGGKIPGIGTKGQPGPLYYMKGLDHAWSALGVAITYIEKYCK
jgi:hypothetical protein